MSNLIRAYLFTHLCLEVGKERYGTPLFAALVRGFEETVQALVRGYAATQPLDSWFYGLGSQYRYNSKRQRGFWKQF